MSAIPSDWRQRLLILAAIGLAGATAFGLWHVIVGGFVNGNGAAAEFGLALAALAGALLTVDLAVLRLLRD